MFHVKYVSHVVNFEGKEFMASFTADNYNNCTAINFIKILVNFRGVFEGVYEKTLKLTF